LATLEFARLRQFKKSDDPDPVTRFYQIAHFAAS
jgi:hypothetical protein